MYAPIASAITSPSRPTMPFMGEPRIPYSVIRNSEDRSRSECGRPKYGIGNTNGHADSTHCASPGAVLTFAPARGFYVRAIHGKSAPGDLLFALRGFAVRFALHRGRAPAAGA